MALAALIPILAPLILEALDGWLSAGKITPAQYEEAKAFYTEARTRTQKAVDDFNSWMTGK